MSTESDLKTKLVAQCKKAGAYARRVEDRHAVGILDIIVAFSELPVCFAEAKIIHHSTFGPTERQWIEGDRILQLKGGHAIPVMIGWDDNKMMYVGPWARSLSIDECDYQLKGDDYASTLWRFVREHTRANRE